MVNRKPLIAEAMGLGPVWLSKAPRDAQALPCWLDAPAGTGREAMASAQDIDTADAMACAQDFDTATGEALTAEPAGAPQLDDAMPPPLPVVDAAPAAAPATHMAAPETSLPAAPTPTGETANALPLLSWEALQAAVHDCQRCRLGQTRTHAVFGRGHAGARWLLVGEAPGEQEDRQGFPFVGRAGKLLDNMLAAAGLSTEHDVYIANVLKCRPPGNRNPQGDEIAACQAYLHQQIAHIRPQIILALGRFAAQTLLESSESISRLRGRVHRYQDVPMIVTFHPAYLLRNPPDKSKAWQDWILAKNTLPAT